MNSELKNNLIKTSHEFQEAVLRIPLNQRAVRFLKGYGEQDISVTDLIAYQIGWGCLLIGWYRAGLKKQVPQMPGEGFSTWD